MNEYNDMLHSIRDALEAVVHDFDAARSRLDEIEQDGIIRSLTKEEMELMEHIKNHDVFEVQTWVLKGDDGWLPRLNPTEPAEVLAWQHRDYFCIGNPEGFEGNLWGYFKLPGDGKKVPVRVIEESDEALANLHLGGNVISILQTVAKKNFEYTNADIAGASGYIWRVVSVLPVENQWRVAGVFSENQS